MTRIPDTVGDTYADIVVWKWDKFMSRWTSDLSDGSRLTVQMKRRARRTFWTFSVKFSSLIDVRASHSYESTDVYKTPTEAEQAALACWRKARP